MLYFCIKFRNKQKTFKKRYSSKSYKNKESMARINSESLSETLSKSNVWDYQENDIFRMWESLGDDGETLENTNHLLTIIRTAFEIEEVKLDRPEVIKKYEDRGMTVGVILMEDGPKKFAIKKRSVKRVTDLTYENIHHISAAKLLEVIDRNFGGGWDSLSQSIKDIIESGFDISTTTLPKDRLHKAGGLYEKKVEDGFEVLEIAKGTWVEAIFAKLKPKAVKIKSNIGQGSGLFGDEDYEDDDVDIKDDYYKQDEDDDTFDEDKLDEESYRTTFDETQDDLGLEAAEMSEDGYED